MALGRKAQRKENAIAFRGSGRQSARALKLFWPLQAHGRAEARAGRDCRDLEKPVPMNRLLRAMSEAGKRLWRCKRQ